MQCRIGDKPGLILSVGGQMLDISLPQGEGGLCCKTEEVQTFEGGGVEERAESVEPGLDGGGAEEFRGGVWGVFSEFDAVLDALCEGFRPKEASSLVGVGGREFPETSSGRIDGEKVFAHDGEVGDGFAGWGKHVDGAVGTLCMEVDILDVNGEEQGTVFEVWGVDGVVVDEHPWPGGQIVGVERVEIVAGSLRACTGHCGDGALLYGAKAVFFPEVQGVLGFDELGVRLKGEWGVEGVVVGGSVFEVSCHGDKRAVHEGCRGVSVP